MSGVIAALFTSTVESAEVALGVARIDVTPSVPTRLTGYAGRSKPSTGVEQKLWAKALAIGSDQQQPALLLTLDNCGIAEATYLEVAQRLAQRWHIKQERLVIACSHTHTGPCTTDWAPNIFANDIPPEHQKVIDLYTRELIEKLEQVAGEALKARRPGTLAWSQGSVAFAKNRRTANGPVDQSLPVLRADVDGRLIAVVANYACHCTTLGGGFNQICGDWAGYAQEAIERDNPGAIALITIGCGADANPSPIGGADGGLTFARQNGNALGMEVKVLLGRNFTRLTSTLTASMKHIELPFEPHFTRAQWEERAKQAGIVGYHARRWLARLDGGMKLPSTLSYYIQTWNFGDDLAMVFLNGEVVVDYALRLKQEFDPGRLWVMAYANYVPCYIPSRRILSEGGYEAESSLWYYDRPARLASEVEELIMSTVHQLVPAAFVETKMQSDHPKPKSPAEALTVFQHRAELTVDLVAAEPLIESPVAIDWGADGRLWVCEMYDYPSGLDGKFKPGGRIKVLSRSRADGPYDQSILFLDGLPFPTGVMPWGKGALICAAPDILYAEDTDGDGRADLVRTNITGFATHNFQARVNGFTWGLDGWLYGSGGLFGGRVKSLLTGKEVELSGRDFRYRPETGEIEPAGGISQMGRVRDDFDRWFGNNNSTLLDHYPLPDHYLRRNPYVAYPDPGVSVARGGDPNKLFPASRTLERFNDPDSANRVTSGCGPGIYRDNLLGREYVGNAFTCEPVHDLVTRLVLEPNRATFTGHRAAGEESFEFLASKDNWFRPVQVRTGPDGALWVVDMYRFVIEHPRWIPPDRLASLDPRAGADRGRIYRVYPQGAKLRGTLNLTRASGIQLAEAIDTPNGVTRDLAQMEFSKRGAEAFTPEAILKLRDLAAKSPEPAIRAQTLATLGAGPGVPPESLHFAFKDSHPGVRALGLRLAEPMITKDSEAHPDVLASMLSLAEDPDAGVRCQLAFSLGASDDPRALDVLSTLAQSEDRWQTAAALSSAARHPGAILDRVVRQGGKDPAAEKLRGQLTAVAIGVNDLGGLAGMIAAAVDISKRGTKPPDAQTARMLADFLDAVERKDSDWRGYLARPAVARTVADPATLPILVQRVEAFLAAAHRQLPQAGQAVWGADTAANERLLAYVRLIGRSPEQEQEDVSTLTRWLIESPELELRGAVLERLRHVRATSVATSLLARWPACPPSVRREVIPLLVAREEWTAALLGALESGTVSVGEIPLAVQQRLLQHENSALRDRSEKFLAAHKPASRVDVLVKYQGVTDLKGTPELGAAVFDKNCSTCHALKGHGHAVGPNLGEFAGKSVSDFLVAILDPNAAINPNFLAYNIETRDGRSLSGIVRGETASSLTLMQSGGVAEKILRSDLLEVRASQLSLMPEGLEQVMTPQELADLIAWVKNSSPATFGTATAEQAASARASFLKSGAIGLGKIVGSADPLQYGSWLGRWPMYFCRQDGSSLTWQTPTVITPSPDAPKEGRSQPGAVFRVPAAMGLVSQTAGGFTVKLNGRAMLNFDVTLTDQSWESADGKVRMSYTVMENNSEDSNGTLVIEVAPGVVPPGKPAQFTVTGANVGSQRWFGVYLLPEFAGVNGR